MNSADPAPQEEAGQSPAGAASGAGNSSSARLRLRRWFRPGALLLAVLLCWGIPELIVRSLDPPLQAFEAIRFGGDPNSAALFRKDPHLHWKLRPSARVEFLGQSVEINSQGCRTPPPATDHRGSDPARTLVCLGDSTTFGWQVAAQESFPARLESLLANESWRVINAGVPGYSSLQVRLQAERWLPRWQPEVVVICVGNNEGWPVEKSDRRLHEERRVEAAVTALLTRSSFLSWAAERLRPQEEIRAFIAASLEGTEPRVSPADFEDNVARTIALARGQGARVILLGPPTNLYRAPLRIENFIDRQTFINTIGRIESLNKQRRFDEAMQMVDAALATDPGNFWHLWCRGGILHAMGRFEEAREQFELAFDHHPYPERCRRSYRRILQRLADTYDAVSFLDVNDLFHRVVAPGAAARLYLDWCHPTAEGHRLIAEALAPMVP